MNISHTLGSVALFLASCALLGVLWKIYVQEMERRAALEIARIAYDRRPRGTIVEIGTVVRGEDGKEHPADFLLNCRSEMPAQWVQSDGKTVHHLFAGYTEAELIEIARRRKEFEP